MLFRFLQTLHDSGRAELAQPGRDLTAAMRRAGAEPEEARRVYRILEAWHGEAVLELPGPALAFHPDAAFRGAIFLFRAACLASFREIGEKEVRELLARAPMPREDTPEAHFSADLCLRHWPDLYRMARARSEDDPLVKVMLELAAEFPLSCLGMGVAIAKKNSPVLAHAGLRQWFVERALERADHATLALPEIRGFARVRLGAHASTLGRGLISSSIES